MGQYKLVQVIQTRCAVIMARVATAGQGKLEVIALNNIVWCHSHRLYRTFLQEATCSIIVSKKCSCICRAHPTQGWCNPGALSVQCWDTGFITLLPLKWGCPCYVCFSSTSLRLWAFCFYTPTITLWQLSPNHPFSSLVARHFDKFWQALTRRVCYEKSLSAGSTGSGGSGPSTPMATARFCYLYPALPLHLC